MYSNKILIGGGIETTIISFVILIVFCIGIYYLYTYYYNVNSSNSLPISNGSNNVLTNSLINSQTSTLAIGTPFYTPSGLLTYSQSIPSPNTSIPVIGPSGLTIQQQSLETVQQASAQQASAQQASAQQVSAQQVSAQRVSAQRVSAQQASVQQASAQQASVQQASAQQASAQQASAQQASVQQAQAYQSYMHQQSQNYTNQQSQQSQQQAQAYQSYMNQQSQNYANNQSQQSQNYANNQSQQSQNTQQSQATINSQASQNQLPITCKNQGNVWYNNSCISQEQNCINSSKTYSNNTCVSCESVNKKWSPILGRCATLDEYYANPWTDYYSWGGNYNTTKLDYNIQLRMDGAKYCHSQGKILLSRPLNSNTPCGTCDDLNNYGGHGTGYTWNNNTFTSTSTLTSGGNISANLSGQCCANTFGCFDDGYHNLGVYN